MEANIYDEIKNHGPLIRFRLDSLEKFIESANFISEFVRRDIFTDKFSWAVPSKKAIEEIAQFIGKDQCLEIGSGLGLWAYLLKLQGINIIATDNKSDKNITEQTVNEYRDIEGFEYLKSIGLNPDILNYKVKSFMEVEVIDGIKALEKYKTNCLLLCWSRINPTKDFQGNKIIYIGESKGGCTKGIPDKKEWIRVKIIDIPQWYGIHDYVALYERKTS